MKRNMRPSNKVLDDVRLLGVNVPVGGRSTHLTCPVCGGGRSKEKSFVISRAEHVLFYKCYRNACDWSGAIPSVPSQGNIQARKKEERPPDPYPWETRALNEVEIQFLQTKYELYRDTVVLNRVKYNISKDKYVFPIMDIEGKEIGMLDRDFRPGHIKAFTTWFSYRVPHLHFPRPLNKRYHRRIILVEDIISANKINQIDRVACLALLGTHISDVTMQYLAAITDGITVMLDPDAIKTALRIRKRYALMFKQPIAVVQLRADPKDTPLKKLQELIF